MTTIAVPLLWRYHARALASTGPWAARIALATPALIGMLSVLLAGGDATAYHRWLSDEILPLLATIAIAVALWPETRSGAVRVWAVSPDRTCFRWLLQRGGMMAVLAAALLLAGMLLGMVVNLMLGIVTEPQFDPGFFAGYLFAAALTLTGTFLFRHPIGGIALTVAYWLLDLRLGVAGNPLFSLHATTWQLDHKSNVIADWLNKPVLLASTALMLAGCSAASARLVQPTDRRELPRLAGVLAGGFLAVLMAQVALGVGILYLTRQPLPPLPRVVQPLRQGGRTLAAPVARVTSVRALGAPLEVFKPVPLSLLFGPVYHGLINLPAGETRPTSGSAAAPTAENARPRIEALTRLLRNYGNWPWADTAAYELAVSRTSVDGVGALKDYWNLAQRYPNSPYAVDSLATIMKTTEVWVLMKKSPNSRGPGSYDRLAQTQPLQPRLSAAIALLQRYPNSAASAEAREMVLAYFPALIRPDLMLTVAPKAAENTRGSEKALWLTVIAEIEINRGRFPEADKAMKEARKQVGAADSGASQMDDHLSRRLRVFEQLLELWRSKQPTGAGS